MMLVIQVEPLHRGSAYSSGPNNPLSIRCPRKMLGLNILHWVEQRYLLLGNRVSTRCEIVTALVASTTRHRQVVGLIRAST
jgi:hypothetical protein